MAVISIIKSNLKAKKGNFFSMFVLVFIIALSLTTIISVNDGASERLKKAGDASNIGDMVSFIPQEQFTEEMLKGLKTSKEVSRVEAIKSITSSGVVINGNSYSSTVFMTAYAPELHSYEIFDTDSLSFLKDNKVKPGKGEIYVPICFENMFHCQTGDEVVIDTANGPTAYRIARFIEEPYVGSSMIGFKMLFMNEEYLQELYSNQDGKTIAGYTVLSVYLKDGYKDTLSLVKKTLNERTGFVNAALYTLSREEANTYTLMLSNILSGVLWAFAALLFIIILIIIGHSVSTGIEMDYVPLGILKAQGFTSLQIRLTLLAGYLIAAFMGSVTGIIVSSFVIKYLSRIFIPITGLLINGSIKFTKSIGVMLLLLLFISLYTLIKTRKVTKISPVQAISCGHAPVYFSGRMDFSITGEFPLPLGIKMTLKQIAGNGRRYISGIIIMAILVFFTITVTSLDQMSTADNIDSIFGSLSSDLCLYYQEDAGNLPLAEIKADIEGKSPILKEFQIANVYFTLDGLAYLGKVIDKQENIIEPLKGRLPKYDNEIILTETMSREIGKGIGDTVSLEYDGAKKDYMIVGINQNISDAGKNFTLLLSGMNRLSPDYTINSMDFQITDSKKSAEIVNYLKDKYKAYKDRIDIVDEYKETQELTKNLFMGIASVTAITYILALIFAAIVALIICQKSFIREQSDMGILKSVGFTTSDLRRQFTLRFLIVVLIGSLIGMTANFLCNNALMGFLLSGVGMTHFITSYSAYNILVPIATICGFTAIFSWLVSGKIKRVSPKNLIQE